MDPTFRCPFNINSAGQNNGCTSPKNLPIKEDLFKKNLHLYVLLYIFPNQKI